MSDEDSPPPAAAPLPLPPLVIGSNGFVSAVAPSTGQELWRTRLQSGLFTSTGGADVSVLVRGEMIFAGSAGHLFCLSTATGQILWSNALAGMGHNDLSLAMEGIAVQYLEKVVHRNRNR